jgi:hypothetical protein
VFGLRETPHRYSVGDAGCRMLFIFTPGGFESLIREMSEPAATRTLPPPSKEEPDFERIAALGVIVLLTDWIDWVSRTPAQLSIDDLRRGRLHGVRRRLERRIRFPAPPDR